MTDAYLRFPHLHADLITFVAEDDVWSAPLEGGRAWRISVDQVPPDNPRFSPDGALIAWTSSRDVEPEVHVAPVDGGPSRRLTHWGDVTTQVLGWTPDGRVLARSSTGRPSTRGTFSHAVPVEPGAPELLPFGPVGAVDVAADGAVLLGTVVSREPAHWKRYRGGTAGKIWVRTAEDEPFTRILSDVDGHVVSPMWVGGRVAFLSDHEGVGNLYSCAPDGSDVRKHSHHEDFYARNAASDGARVVYHRAGGLWLLDGLDAEPRRVDVRLGGPRPDRGAHPVDPGRNLGSVGVDRTGRASAVEVRGTVHWVTHRDGPARALSDDPAVRARLPLVLGTTGQVVWVTDAGGEESLEVGPVEGREPGVQPRRIGFGGLGRVLELAASPDGRKLAVVTHDRRLLLVDVDSGDLDEVATTDSGDAEDLVFSPDSGWLAWSHPGPDPLRRIRLLNVADRTAVDVTDLRFTDTDPAFTLDGKHLVFLSQRSFDPVYDTHVFDVSFHSGARPYLVPLAATTPSPFAPVREGRPFGGADDTDDTPAEKDAPPRTAVDVEGIGERVIAFPVPAARYTGLFAAKGGVLWLRLPVTGRLGDDLREIGQSAPRPVLERFDLAKLKTDVLVDGLTRAWPSGDGARLVVRDGARLRVVPADRKADPEEGGEDNVVVDLDRVRVVPDPAAQWRQAFDENGRIMRDHFWRADMDGVDWAGALARYRPLVDAVATHDDLVDLLWEVQGELGTSHSYVTAPGAGRDHRRRVGLLGADLARDGDGAWRVAAIIPGDSSDPAARSPLRAPGVAVRVGDAIVGVDGRPVDPATGPAPLLVGAAGHPVELTVLPGGGGAARRVVVVPLLDDMPLRYQALVAGRRAHVHEATGGRVGYLHVPDMMAAGWSQLHRDLRGEMLREAVLVDLRENRGGHLSQLVVEKIARRVIGWTVARDDYVLEAYPLDAARGPVVALVDEFTGSDGEIGSAAIQRLKAAPVVGVRTWGGVIGMDRRYSLVDGTAVTQPRYASWIEGVGWGVENHGIDPDVEVVATPDDKAAGRDPQLAKAIELALAGLAVTPAATPPARPAPKFGPDPTG
ncbi:S41 family peptidase [Actinokineospora pegani]|uniref:S41 family peptidase n=1 Tax=Actinokineospora pegani TaxID=2654637 RepID=UPI0012E9EF80|nr:S41 family peptidase [Actinokineospora pegani]